MSKNGITIRFGGDPAEAGRYAQELREEILDASPKAQVNMAREDPEAQDLGSLLAVVVAQGSEAATHSPALAMIGGELLIHVVGHVIGSAIYHWWERRGKP